MEELICEFKAVLYWVENSLLKDHLDDKDIYEHENILHHYKSFIKNFEKEMYSKAIIALKSQAIPLNTFKNLKII